MEHPFAALVSAGSGGNSTSMITSPSSTAWIAAPCAWARHWAMVCGGDSSSLESTTVAPMPSSPTSEPFVPSMCAMDAVRA